MSEETPAITLYRLQACPFCERVVRKLDEYDLDYRSRFVEPMHSDRNVVKRISGKRTVPAVVDETTGVTMSESANIVEYLDATYGDGERAATDGGRPVGDGDGEREGEGTVTGTGDADTDTDTATDTGGAA
jgi:glutaredoxin